MLEVGSRLATVLIGTALLVACSSDDEAKPPPPFKGELFTDSFDDPAPLPHGWDVVRGNVVLAAGPSGGQVLQARAVSPKHEESTLKRSMVAKGSTSITCRLSVALSKTGGTTGQSVARIDVLGGAVILDLQPNAWRMFGKIGGGQDFADGAQRPVLEKWSVVTLRIENSGKVVINFDGDERVQHVDVKNTPIDVAKSSIELGLFAPPKEIDSEVSFDDVSCSAE